MSQTLEVGDETNQPNNGPKPLSGEAQSVELEIDPKKKPQDKKAIANFRDRNYIKQIVETPKEPSSNSGGATNGNTGDANTSSNDVNEIRQRINSEPSEPISLSGNSNSSSIDDGEAPDEADCKLYAEMIVEGIDWLAVWGFQYYAKDPEEEAYKPSPERKKKLMQLLAKMLMRVGKKHPVALYFFATLILMYVPSFRKAHTHKQKVEAEKAAQALLNEEIAAKKESEGGKKRRSLKNDNDIADATLEAE